MRLEPLAHHVTCRLVEDRVLAPSRVARLAVMRWVLPRVEEAELIAFALADTHLHAVLLGPRRRAGCFVRRLETGLHVRARPGVPFAAAHFKPVRDVWHLENCFWYVLDQHAKHELAADPLREGTLLPDLLGLRVGGTCLAARVREQLPRVGSAALRQRLGFDRSSEGRPEHLEVAAAAAVLLPDLRGGCRSTLAARRAAVHLGLARWPAARVRETLELPRRTMSRHAATSVEPGLIRAVALQLALRGGRAIHGDPEAQRGPIWPG